MKYAHNREFILFVQFLQPVAGIFPKIKDCTPFYFPVYSPFFLVSVIILLFSFFPDGYLPYETLIPVKEVCFATVSAFLPFFPHLLLCGGNLLFKTAG